MKLSEAIGVGRDLAIIAFLILGGIFFVQNSGIDVYRISILNTQKEHRGLIERLHERLDKLKKDEDDRHEGLLERLKILEKKRGDVGEKP